MNNSKNAIESASTKKEFSDEIRSKALAFSGDIDVSCYEISFLEKMKSRQIQLDWMIGQLLQMTT